MILSMKNKYIYRSRISEKKFREIRILMSKECEKISKFSGEISSSQARLEASL